MKYPFKKTLMTLALLAFTATAVMAQVYPGDINRLKGLILNAASITATTGTITTLNATTETVTTQNGTTYNVGKSGTAGTMNIFPATAANGIFKLLAVNNTGPFNSTISNSNIGQATVYSLPDAGAATANILVSSGAQTVTGAYTFGAGSSIVSKTSTSATDINPPFDNRVLGNPVVKYVYGSCTVAAVNAGTCIPLALATGRTISVMNFDIVAAGSAATCTGIKLEDTNGTPVVIATLAAATLTSGAHNVPLTATLGVGFGAGSGLTVSQGVQILVNGSACTTTTAFQYAISYTVQ